MKTNTAIYIAEKLTKLQIEWLSRVCRSWPLKPPSEDRAAGAVLTGLSKKGLILWVLTAESGSGYIATGFGKAVNKHTNYEAAKDWTRPERKRT